jgi:hypothetical protein
VAKFVTIGYGERRLRPHGCVGTGCFAPSLTETPFCAGIASRHPVIVRRTGERLDQIRATHWLLLAAARGRLVSGVLVMPGSGPVYKRCGRGGAGSVKAREGRCPALWWRGHGSWYFSLELERASIVLAADTYASVLPQVAREAAERTASLVLRDAGRVRRQVRRRAGRRGSVLVPPWTHRGEDSARSSSEKAVNWGFCGAPGRIRTCGHRIGRPPPLRRICGGRPRHECEPPEPAGDQFLGSSSRPAPR